LTNIDNNSLPSSIVTSFSLSAFIPVNHFSSFVALFFCQYGAVYDKLFDDGVDSFLCFNHTNTETLCPLGCVGADTEKKFANIFYTNFTKKFQKILKRNTEILCLLVCVRDGTEKICNAIFTQYLKIFNLKIFKPNSCLYFVKYSKVFSIKIFLMIFCQINFLEMYC